MSAAIMLIYPKNIRNVNGANMIRRLLRIVWSFVGIIGGAYVIEKLTITSPNISSLVLPLYFILVLAALYSGHLLIDVITHQKLFSHVYLQSLESSNFVEFDILGKDNIRDGYKTEFFMVVYNLKRQTAPETKTITETNYNFHSFTQPLAA